MNLSLTFTLKPSTAFDRHNTNIEDKTSYHPDIPCSLVVIYFLVLNIFQLFEEENKIANMFASWLLSTEFHVSFFTTHFILLSLNQSLQPSVLFGMSNICFMEHILKTQLQFWIKKKRVEGS